jgi:thiol-disulfide isomerase/thioredoxin
LRLRIGLLAAVWGTLGACLAVAAPSPADGLKGVEEKAPPIELQEVLQAPAGARATPQGLRGKVVVLEFWATWCGTCVRSIPHLNDLADELKDEIKDGRVVFIAVTDEAKEDVDKETAAKLALAQPGILVLDPGPHPDQLGDPVPNGGPGYQPKLTEEDVADLRRQAPDAPGR